MELHWDLKKKKKVNLISSAICFEKKKKKTPEKLEISEVFILYLNLKLQFVTIMALEINLGTKLILMKKLQKHCGRDPEQWENFAFDVNFAWANLGAPEVNGGAKSSYKALKLGVEPVEVRAQRLWLS